MKSSRDINIRGDLGNSIRSGGCGNGGACCRGNGVESLK